MMKSSVQTLLLIVLTGVGAINNFPEADLPDFGVESFGFQQSENVSRKLLLTNAVCNQVEAANPDTNCICRRPSLLRNKGLTVDCTNDNAFCIPLLGCFTLQYSGEFYVFRSSRQSTSQLCLTETQSMFNVFCIKGIHCQGNVNCYQSCSATVGTATCESCTVCPGGLGVTVNCTNVIPLLTYSDCGNAAIRSTFHAA